ncbi:MAG: PAS domain S-box protein [Haloarculaceae archaeon]
MTRSSAAPIEVRYVGAPDRARAAAGALDTERDALSVSPEPDPGAARTAVADGDADCLVCTAALPDGDAVALLEALRDGHPEFPFVIHAVDGDEARAAAAVSAGVTDYVLADGPTHGLAALADAVEAGVADYRTARALEESEEHYRTLVEGSHDGIYIYRDDEFVFVNDRVCEITGYSEAELADMEIWQLVHPADRDRVRAFGERRRRGEPTPDTYDARVVTKDGETRYLEFSVQQITVDGEWAALGSTRDVTERRERERELRNEQEFIETVLDTLADVFFVFTPQGELLRWNQQLPKVTGYDDDELADLTVFDLLAGEYYEDAVDAIRETILQGAVAIEAEIVTADGERVPFEFRGSPLTDSDGEVMGIAGVARDISQRLDREAELAQYRTIVEAVGDAVYTIDAEGRFTLVNEALAEITGYDQDELIGEHVAKLMRDRDVETARETIRELLTAEAATQSTFEMEAVTADGEHIPCEDHMALLPTDSGFRGTAGVVRDISERTERIRRLRRQNEQLDQFASVVSHDLRNPLNVITARLDLARETGDDEHFEAIERSARRMERLIDDLLTLAREGQTVGELDAVDLGSAARDAWRHVETGRAELAVEAAPPVAADGDRLASLLENLFRNSIEHGAPAGADETTAEEAAAVGSAADADPPRRADGDRPVGAGGADPALTVHVGPVTGPDGTVEGFYVEDDGTGIPPEERERIFEHGYSSESDGTGLGLVIVQGIVEAHGWEIRATESERHDGSTPGARFEITGVDPAT